MKYKHLLSIKDFSELTGISQSKLRYYDEMKLFKPTKRDDNGYRYYSLPQTIAANCVNIMSSLNIPMKKYNEFKKEKSPELILELLQKQGSELNKELYRLQQAYALIHTYCEMIREGLQADEKAITTCWMASVSIELGAENDFSSGDFYDSFFVFLKQMAAQRVDPAYPAGGYYRDMDAFANQPGFPTRYFSHAPTGRDVKEAGKYLVGYTRGYYGNIGDLPQRMLAHASEHGLLTHGPVYEMYLHDEVAVEDPEQYLIQASVMVS